jgi:hypothetical protein
VEAGTMAAGSTLIILIENRNKHIGLHLRAHDPSVYSGERIQGLLSYIDADEHEVATLLVERIQRRQRDALLGKRRTIFGHTVYELHELRVDPEMEMYAPDSTKRLHYDLMAVDTVHAGKSLKHIIAEQLAKPSKGTRYEPRFLLIGWVKQLQRELRCVAIVFRTVNSCETTIQGLPESAAFRQYLYTTFISYAHSGAGGWTYCVDSGGPFNEQTLPSKIDPSHREVLPTDTQSGVKVTSYFGVGSTPVFSVMLSGASIIQTDQAFYVLILFFSLMRSQSQRNVGIFQLVSMSCCCYCRSTNTYCFDIDHPSVVWPPQAIHLQIDNNHNGIRLMNGRFFASSMHAITEMGRHILPNNTVTGTFTPDLGAHQAIGILGFQVVSADGTLFNTSPFLIVSWCIGCQHGRECAKFHADILQTRETGYDGCLGALHTPDALFDILPRNGMMHDWIAESVALVDKHLPYRIGIKVNMDYLSVIHVHVILSGKGSVSLHSI